MAKIASIAERAEHKAAHKAKEAVSNPIVDGLTRLGYVVRGLLYAVVGLLALQLVFGKGGAATDKNGALGAIAAQPFGKGLLVAVLVGLVGYSLWGFIRALLDPLNRGTDPEGLLERAGYVVSGLSYGALIFPTWRLLTNTGGSDSGQGSQGLAAGLLSQPWGPWLLGIIGLISVGGGFGQFYQAYTADFEKDFKANEMTAGEMRWAVRVARFGLVARGVVFALSGVFLVQAAINHDPKEAKGLDAALQTLLQEPYGPWLLGIVALGLVSFGVYSILCARWMKSGL
jgi:hypothetical protein